MTDFDAVRYKRNFLTEVVARIDFATPIEGLAKSLPESLNQTALKTFPLREPRQGIARELQIGPVQIESKSEEFTEWTFHGRNREKTLSIGPAWVLVTYKRYETFEIFRSEFLAQVDAFFKLYPHAEPSRIGLRYINQIELPNGNPLNWKDYLIAPALAIFDVASGSRGVVRAMQNLELSEADFRVRLQFGMHNPDYPAPIRRRLFVIDADAYSDGYFPPGDTGARLDAFHSRVQSLFEAMITAKMREVLNAAE